MYSGGVGFGGQNHPFILKNQEKGHDENISEKLETTDLQASTGFLET